MTESPRVGLKRMIKRGILPVVKEENAYDQRNLFRGTVLRPAAAGAAAQAGEGGRPAPGGVKRLHPVPGHGERRRPV